MFVVFTGAVTTAQGRAPFCGQWRRSGNDDGLRFSEISLNLNKQVCVPYRQYVIQGFLSKQVKVKQSLKTEERVWMTV